MTVVPTEPWRIVAYEVRMFRATYDILFNPKQMEKLSSSKVKVYVNAIEESAVLHTRILCEVILSKAKSDDDIVLSTLLTDWPSGFQYRKLKRIVNTLRIAYGSPTEPGDICWTFNKMMAHPTKKRGISYDYTGMLDTLRPKIEDAIREIEASKGDTFKWSW